MRFARKFAIILAAFAIILSFTACEFFFDEEGNLVFRLYQVSGRVINVRETADSKDNIPTSGDVRIYKFGDENNPVRTGEVKLDGSFSLGDVPAGDYMLKFDDDGTYFGIPVAIKIYGSGTVSGLGALVFSTGELGGNSVVKGDVLIISTWEERKYDIDTYAVLGTTPLSTPVNPTDAAYGQGTNTRVVGFKKPSITTGYDKVYLERDTKVSDLASSSVHPVETMLIKDLSNELRYYVHYWGISGTYDGGDEGNGAYGSITGLDVPGNVKKPAGVITYVMYMEENNKAVHYGTFYPPLNTDSRAVGMVRLARNNEGGITIGPFGVGDWGSVMRGLEDNRAYYGEAVNVMN